MGEGKRGGFAGGLGGGGVGWFTGRRGRRLRLGLQESGRLVRFLRRALDSTCGSNT